MTALLVIPTKIASPAATMTLEFFLTADAFQRLATMIIQLGSLLSAQRFAALALLSFFAILAQADTSSGMITIATALVCLLSTLMFHLRLAKHVPLFVPHALMRPSAEFAQLATI